MAVGALLDFISGAVPRAPLWMRHLRLEWLFRLVIEPGRLWRRYIVGNPVFLARVLRQKLYARRGRGKPSVNSRFVPHAGARPRSAPTTRTTAIVTASYAPDFERCRLLCETIDRFVTGASHHYILVEQRDVALFRQLADARPHRRQRARPAARLAAPLRRSAQPVQPARLAQPEDAAAARLARAAAPAHRDRRACRPETLWSTAIPTSPSSSRSIARVFWRDGMVRLFRRDDAHRRRARATSRSGRANAGTALGIAASPAVAARLHRDADRLAARDGRGDVPAHRGKCIRQHWVEAVASARKFSECMHLWPLRRRSRSAAPAISTAPRNSAACTGSATPHVRSRVPRLHRRDDAGAGGDRHAVLHRHRCLDASAACSERDGQRRRSRHTAFAGRRNAL